MRYFSVGRYVIIFTGLGIVICREDRVEEVMNKYFDALEAAWNRAETAQWWEVWKYIGGWGFGR